MYIRWRKDGNWYFGVAYYGGVGMDEVVNGYAEDIYQPAPFIIPLVELHCDYREISIEKYYDLLHQHVILMMKVLSRKGLK